MKRAHTPNGAPNRRAPVRESGWTAGRPNPIVPSPPEVMDDLGCGDRQLRQEIQPGLVDERITIMRRVAILAIQSILLIALAGLALNAGAEPFADEAFERTWARTDQPVAALQRALQDDPGSTQD
jgi:hypothetical protein